MPQQKNPEHTLLFVGVTAGYSQEHLIFNNSSFQLTGPALYHLEGKNGHGKSTFAELVSGYLKPYSGKITLGADNVQLPKSRLKRRICRDKPALFGRMTVRDHLAFACMAHHCDVMLPIKRAKDLGLGPWLDENADTLSAGNAQKLWYVLCTVGQFQFLVLDEPFNAVYADSAEKIAMEILGFMHTALVVIITHHLPAPLNCAKPLSITDLTAPEGAIRADDEKNISEGHRKVM